jgi:hypothetical protein
VTEINEEEVVSNLTTAFLNIYDQIPDNKIHRFSKIVEIVFSKIIEFIFKENVDDVYNWLDNTVDD